jgi:sphingomyelin phosphodiesterase
VCARTTSANYFNYINMSTSDNSGMLRFLTDELQDAEDAGDRGELHKEIADSHFRHAHGFILVWILGHVLSGWDGTNPLNNPTNLCKCCTQLVPA